MSETPKKIDVEKYQRLKDRQRALQSNQTALREDRRLWVDHKRELESARDHARHLKFSSPEELAGKYDPKIGEATRHLDYVSEQLATVGEQLSPLNELLNRLDKWLQREGIDIPNARLHQPGSRTLTEAPHVLPPRGFRA